MKWQCHKGVRIRDFWDKEAIIDVYVCEHDIGTFMVLAERYDNPSDSVTNNYYAYALEMADRLDVDIAKTSFFELYRYPPNIPGGRAEISLDVVKQPSDRGHGNSQWRPANEKLKSAITESLSKQATIEFS